MAGDDKIVFDGSDRPPRYRALILGEAGEIIEMVRLKADDDPTALVQAQALVDGHAVEPWEGLRYIKHFPPVDWSP